MTQELPWNPQDWYWIVGGDETRLWSSARSTYVPVGDATLAEWVASGGSVCRADAEENIWGVTGKPFDLRDYLADKRWRVETGGIVCGGVLIATDDRSKLLLMGAREKAKSDPSSVEKWASPDGSITTIDADTVIAISDAVAAHVSVCFDAYAVIVAEIEAGTVTTAAEIDAANWPSNN